MDRLDVDLAVPQAQAGAAIPGCRHASPAVAGLAVVRHVLPHPQLMIRPVQDYRGERWRITWYVIDHPHLNRVVVAPAWDGANILRRTNTDDNRVAREWHRDRHHRGRMTLRSEHRWVRPLTSPVPAGALPPRGPSREYRRPR